MGYDLPSSIKYRGDWLRPRVIEVVLWDVTGVLLQFIMNTINPLDARRIGVKIVYEMLRKTIRDAVNDFIMEMDINPLDAADIRHKLLEKDILKVHVPCSKEEEMDAMDWLCDLRSRLKM